MQGLFFREEMVANGRAGQRDSNDTTIIVEVETNRTDCRDGCEAVSLKLLFLVVALLIFSSPPL